MSLTPASHPSYVLTGPQPTVLSTHHQRTPRNMTWEMKTYTNLKDRSSSGSTTIPRTVSTEDVVKKGFWVKSHTEKEVTTF